MNKDVIDISGIDKVRLLQELYLRAMRLPHLPSPGELTREDAETLLAGAWSNWSEQHAFDYVAGRPVKVTLKGDELRDGWLFDRDAGEGKCREAVEAARQP